MQTESLTLPEFSLVSSLGGGRCLWAETTCDKLLAVWPLSMRMEKLTKLGTLYIVARIGKKNRAYEGQNTC